MGKLQNMSTSNSKTTLILNLFLMLSIFLFISVSGSRIQQEVGLFELPPTTIIEPRCDSAYGVKSGDTCFTVTKMFSLTTTLFDSINPNLNCTGLFVGQWLCVKGIPGN